MKNGTIETTKSYKYLGFLFTPSGEIVSGLKDLRDRALRAYHKAIQKKLLVSCRRARHFWPAHGNLFLFFILLKSGKSP